MKLYIYNKIKYLLVICFFVFATKANAITLDNTNYSLDVYGSVPIIVAPPATDGLLYIYDVVSGIMSIYFDRYNEGDDLNYSRLIPGDYSVVELSPSAGDEWVCNLPDQELLYNECKNLSGFVNEFIFKIKYGSYEYAGGVDEPPLSITIPMYQPIASITSPNSTGFFSKIIPIVYSVVDHNDTFSEQSRQQYGLIENPVSLFYTDIFTRSYDADTSDTQKKLITEGLPATGTYSWDVSGLVEKKFYQVIVRAIDKSGMVGQVVSELFNVDLTAPNFIVQANPGVVKKEKVTITIKSSEKLVTMPTVTVTQRGAEPKKIAITEENGTYTGVYQPVDGFDGTANVSVTGTDFAGNTGNLVVGGGNFTVGINPPAKPTILKPYNNEKVTGKTITINGTIREDTTVNVTVNGKEKYTTKPNDKGEFVVPAVVLDKNNTNGKNIINITSVDTFGAISEPVVLTVYHNIAPTVSLLEQPKTLLVGKTVLSVKGNDENGDSIRYAYEISEDTKNTPYIWKTIENIPIEKITFNTTKFVDGNYVLRVTADDGFTTAVSETVPVQIKNESSFFIRFYDGIHTVTKDSQVTMRGIVFADKKTLPFPTIKSLYYSINDGQNWNKVSALDGAFDSGEERFSVTITGLKPGLYNTLWQTKDSKGTIVNEVQPVIVDQTVPLAPKIISPEANKVLTNADNELKQKDVFTYSINGTSEPDSNVVLFVDGKTYSTKTSYDGIFKISNIVLLKHGVYSMKIFSEDEAKNKSTTIEQNVTYDNPPTIVFTSPRNGKGLGSNTTISWLINDPDKDTIINTNLSYRVIGAGFISLKKDIKTNSYVWDTTKITGKNFELKLETSDGIVKKAETIPFTLDKEVPEIASVANSTGIVNGINFTGKAKDIGTGIEYVEYSIVSVDDLNKKSEIVWHKANVKNVSRIDADFYVKEKTNISDGQYQIAVRAVDFAGNVSEKKYLLISVDTTAPNVGSVAVYNSGVVLNSINNAWNISVGVPLDMVVSLEKNAVSAYTEYEGIKTNLVYDKATGLWKNKIMFETEGTKNVSINVTDSIGNNTQQNLLSFNVSSKANLDSVSNTQTQGVQKKRTSLWEKIKSMLHW